MLKLLSISIEKLIPHLDDELERAFKDTIKLVSSGHDSIDVIMPNMTKGQALRQLLTEWGCRLLN